jgi:hypothetical protein
MSKRAASSSVHLFALAKTAIGVHHEPQVLGQRIFTHANATSIVMSRGTPSIRSSTPYGLW